MEQSVSVEIVSIWLCRRVGLSMSIKRKKAPVVEVNEAPAIKKNKASKRQFRNQDDRSTDAPDWAGLPKDLVDAISKRLPVVSVLSMGAVCESWRRVIIEQVPPTQKRGLPWLMLCGKNDSVERTCLSILENRVMELKVPEAFGRCCWGSIQDWLIVVKNIFKLEIFFWNPFSKTKLLLPNAFPIYHKMVLSTSPNEANCVIILLSTSCVSLATWTPDSKVWRQTSRGVDCFVDAVFCNGCFYFVTPRYEICIIDAESMLAAIKEDMHASAFSHLDLPLPIHEVAMPEKPTWSHVRRYLVESCGEVLLVCRLYYYLDGKSRVTHSFEVFKLDPCQMVWIKLESLGDRVLFIGKSDTRSFSAEDLGADIANCIYFLNDDLHCFSNQNEWSHSTPRLSTFDDWGVFCLGQNSFLPNSSNCMNQESQTPIWITAPTWWCLSDKNSQFQRGVVSL